MGYLRVHADDLPSAPGGATLLHVQGVAAENLDKVGLEAPTVVLSADDAFSATVAVAPGANLRLVRIRPDFEEVAQQRRSLAIHEVALSAGELMAGTLTSLDLSACVVDTAALARTLAADFQIEHLYLNETDADGDALAGMLSTNTHLRSLHLDCNSTDAKRIARALEEDNTTLERLSLRGNPLGEEGGRAMADALRANGTLRELNLCDTTLGEQSLAALGGALAANRGLRKLDVSLNCDATPELFEGVEQNRTLEALNADCFENPFRALDGRLRSLEFNERVAIPNGRTVDRNRRRLQEASPLHYLDEVLVAYSGHVHVVLLADAETYAVADAFSLAVRRPTALTFVDRWELYRL